MFKTLITTQLQSLSQTNTLPNKHKEKELIISPLQNVQTPSHFHGVTTQ